MALSWSISKATILHYCTKKYYFSTYSNYLKEVDKWIWNQAMLAKNLKSIYMRFGEKIHDLMSDYLNLVKEWNDSLEKINEIKQNLIGQMDQEYKISKDREYLNYDYNIKFWLTEHYYWNNIDELYETGKHKILESFEHFLESEFNLEIKKLFADKSNTFFIEPKEKDFDSMKIKIDNIPELIWIDVYAQPDFGIITANKEYLIYDRKSGKIPNKSTEHISDQLKVYAYKILQKIWIENIDNFNAKGFEIYLKTLDQFWWKIKKEDLQQIEQKIISDTKIQKELIIEKDVENNQPLASENFPRTTDLQKCSNCTFFKVCEELKKIEKGDIFINTSDKSITNEYLEDDFPF